MGYKNAFTLVELSIVLVIIGLISGGIVGGLSLVESAKNRALLLEFQVLETAIRNFELQYDALPGDFSEAESYWPSTNTENGDGNGRVDNSSSGSGADEPRRGWYHLQLAEMINNSEVYWWSTVYPYDWSDAENQPAGFQWRLATTHSGSNFERTGNVIKFAGSSSGRSEFTPSAAKKLDNKIDDGKAAAGRFRADDDYGYCHTSAFEYDLMQTTRSCSLFYFY